MRNVKCFGCHANSKAIRRSHVHSNSDTTQPTSRTAQYHYTALKKRHMRLIPKPTATLAPLNPHQIPNIANFRIPTETTAEAASGTARNPAGAHLAASVCSRSPADAAEIRGGLPAGISGMIRPWSAGMRGRISAAVARRDSARVTSGGGRHEICNRQLPWAHVTDFVHVTP